MRDAVASELRLWAREPFDTARANCGLSIVAYVERVTGRILRPSPRLLGRSGMAAIARRPGRFPAFASWAMAQLRCPSITVPQRGDVGLVDLAGSGLTACLCVGAQGWAARGARAVIIMPGVPLIAWRVTCPKR